MAMTSSFNRQYLEIETLSTDPIGLVCMLYEHALQCVAEARICLRNGDVRGRSRAVSKAHDILGELVRSLDHSAGGEISVNLERLYDYVQRKLLEGNFRQQDAPFAEAEALLETLLEGWRACRAANSEAGNEFVAECEAFSLAG